ncbi:hypothetical protein C8J56DRAFT_897398 [Mycena floridula]|nr:hypothetical protein C8J56DRAFT_897398 [Mycena floridula]
MSLLYILLGIVRAVNSALSDRGLLYVLPFPPSSKTKTMALSATLSMSSSQEIKASREEKGSIETRTDWQEFDICSVKEEGKLEAQRKKQKGDAIIPGQESFGTGLETVDPYVGHN